MMFCGRVVFMIVFFLRNARPTEESQRHCLHRRVIDMFAT